MRLFFIPATVREKIWQVLDWVTLAIGLCAFSALIAEFGFYLSTEVLVQIRKAMDFLLILFVLQEALRWFVVLKRRREYFRQRWLENLIALGVLLYFLQPESIHFYLREIIPGLDFYQLTLIYLGVTQSLIVLSLIIKLVRRSAFLAQVKLSPSLLFLASFAFLIVIGTLLLLLPRATTEGISFIDAAFTATSAVCVTGLIVVDTATAFTPLGKGIILFLIQLGGLGIMTLTTFFAMFFTGGISIRERLMLSTILSEENIGEISSLLVRIALFTFVIELLGACVLYASYGASFVDVDLHALTFSIFHSISAFCNAGFSLYSENLMHPEVQRNVLWTLTIAALIILGGLGISVLSNLAELRPWKSPVYRMQHRLTLHTKLVLTTTAILLLFGTFAVLLLEWNHLYADMPLWERIYRAFFFSVTARTAGFNIDAVHQISLPTMFVLLLLMWIGASPGSTGGGIKTTTFAVAALNVVNIVKGRDRLEVFFRQIPVDTIRRAFSIVLLTAFFIGTVTLILFITEPGKDAMDLLFEVTSAMGTVGLSRGITPLLSDAGKIAIIITMFVGRVGILTVLFAIVQQEFQPKYKFPVENVVVG